MQLGARRGGMSVSVFDQLRVPDHSELYHWADYVELLCLTDADGQFSAERLAQIANFADDLMETAPDAQDTTLGDVLDLLAEGQVEPDDADDPQQGLQPAAQVELSDGSEAELHWLDFGRDAEVADNRYVWCQRLFKLLSDREDSLGDAYPFHVESRTMHIERKTLSDNRLLYVFYLACSSLAYVSKKTMQELTAHFEVMSAEVMREMLPLPIEIDLYGTARGLASSRFTGVPYRRLEGLAKDLRGRVMCDARDFHPRDRADNGLDLVAWLPMADAGKGVPAFFSQCACGERWEAKQFEAGYDRWKEFIALTSPPTKITFIPYYYRNMREQWYVDSDVSGVLVDRLRSLRFASAAVLSVLPRELAMRAWDFRLSPV